MILIDDGNSELGRELRNTAPAGVTIIDNAGDFLVSAYPSVVVTLPAKEAYIPQYDELGGLLGVELTAIDEREVIIRMPTSWEAVADYINLL